MLNLLTVYAFTANNYYFHFEYNMLITLRIIIL